MRIVYLKRNKLDQFVKPFSTNVPLMYKSGSWFLLVG